MATESPTVDAPESLFGSARLTGWRRSDALAILAWTAAVTVIFWDVLSFQGALFYFDVTEINYPYRDFVTREFREGRFSRWLPGLYNGMPLFSESQAGYLHPSKVLYLFGLPTWIAFNLDTVLSVWLTGLATYGWLRRHIGAAGALTGASLMGLGGFTWAHLIHTSMINALVSVPLAVWALECSWEGGRRRALALGGLALAIQVFAGHLQDALMTMMVVGLYSVYRSAVESRWSKRLQAVVPGLGMIVLAVAVAAVQWIPSKALIDESPRSGGLTYTEATYGSWHPELLPTLVLRETYGTRARDTDWMDGFYPYHEMNTFLGVVGIALAVVGAAAYRDRWVGFWVLLTGIALVLMLGKFTLVWDVFYALPILGSGRIPVRYHLWLTLAIAALAGVGVERFARPGAVRLRWALIVLGMILLISIPILLLIYRPVWTEADRWTWAYHRNRFNWLGTELAVASVRMLVLLTIAIAVMTRAARTADLLRRSRLAAILPILVMADLLGAHWRDIPTVDPSYWLTPPATARWLQGLPDQERIFGLPDRSVGEPGYASEPVDFFPARDTLSRSLAPVWGLRSSGGHTPIIPRRIDDYDEAANRAGVRFDLEGVTHILLGRRDAMPGMGTPVPIGSALILPNPDALPRARLVGRPVYVADRAAAIAALMSLGTEARQRVIVEDPDQPISVDASAEGSVEIVEDDPERVVVHVETPSPTYLVLADTFDSGWSARLNGEPVPVRPAYIAFRAIAVPAGRHEIIFRYSPQGFGKGLAITSLGLLVTLCCLVWPGRNSPLGPLHGMSSWPKRWPLLMVILIAGIMAISAVDLKKDLQLDISDRWRGSLHRFTWGAGIEAMRLRSETLQ